MDEFHKRMLDTRTGHEMSREDVVIAAARIEGGARITASILRRLEGSSPAISELDADPRWLWTLAQVYDRSVKELSPLAYDRLAMLRDQLVAALKYNDNLVAA